MTTIIVCNVNELLVLAKPKSTNFVSVSIVDLLRETVVLVTPQALMQNVDISLAQSTDVPVAYCDAGQIKQVFINLIKNVLDAMPAGGSMHFHSRVGAGTVVILTFPIDVR